MRPTTRGNEANHQGEPLHDGALLAQQVKASQRRDQQGNGQADLGLIGRGADGLDFSRGHDLPQYPVCFRWLLQTPKPVKAFRAFDGLVATLFAAL
jgi:hypothetical protein